MFERMLVGKIENRITVGLISLVLTMVFLGWAAINEGGRMQAFQQMEHARAIEQGASLFAANCTTCHGLDGRGLAGKAPALNSPMLFGHDFFPDVTKQIANLNGEKKTLTDEKNAAGTTDARKTEIDARITEIDRTIADMEAKRTADVKAAVDKGYNPTGASYNRLLEVGWAGTLDSFLLTTLIHGRPVSATTGRSPCLHGHRQQAAHCVPISWKILCPISRIGIRATIGHWMTYMRSINSRFCPKIHCLISRPSSSWNYRVVYCLNLLEPM